MKGKGKMDNYKMIATCTAGLESVLAYEIRALGIKVTDSIDGRIIFSGSLSDMVKANLWLRSCERIYLVLKEFDADNFDSLFDGISSFRWGDLLPADAKIVISRVKIKNSKLTSEPAIQSVAQKAVFQSMKKKYKLNQFQNNGPSYEFTLFLKNDHVTVSLNSSGDGLHKRGYRLLSGRAPLRETIAAGILMISRWKPGIPLIDPFCGSGTIIIEAGLMAKNMAPGIHRSFAFEDWKFVSNDIVKNERKNSRISIKSQLFEIYGSDSDSEMIEFSNSNALKAGVSNSVKFEKLPMEQVKSSLKYGYVVTNPPYGERLKNEESALNLYMQMRHFKKDLPDWSYFILSSNEQVEKGLGINASKKKKIVNSSLESHLYSFWGPKPDKNRQE